MTIRGKKSLRNAFFRALGPNAASTAGETPLISPVIGSAASGRRRGPG